MDWGKEEGGSMMWKPWVMPSNRKSLSGSPWSSRSQAAGMRQAASAGGIGRAGWRQAASAGGFSRSGVTSFPGFQGGQTHQLSDGGCVDAWHHILVRHRHVGTYTYH